ncbi:hypothetical protein [Streptomyces collinus]|uniref:hypothetical protein n=1 Tax=Streptomyces collinus TaxID=42684 RepID=UPI003640435B
MAGSLAYAGVAASAGWAVPAASHSIMPIRVAPRFIGLLTMLLGLTMMNSTRS